MNVIPGRDDQPFSPTFEFTWLLHATPLIELGFRLPPKYFINWIIAFQFIQCDIPRFSPQPCSVCRVIALRKETRLPIIILPPSGLSWLTHALTYFYRRP
ncbi:hypothetical protein [Streptomyces sp. 049-1]|uniref:hypothetical protein n=1 Tax=Streptomyces sp. 049-1 TaxID=2789264 RepID=UPI0039807D42